MEASSSTQIRVSVCLITFERPAFVRRCLDSLRQLSEPANQIVVVDASAAPDVRLGQRYCDVEYVHVPHLAGRMTSSHDLEALAMSSVWGTG